YLKPLLRKLGLAARAADILTKTAPILAVLATTLVAWALRLDEQGVKLVGTVPSGLPSFTMPSLDPALWSQLAVSALLISVVGFVESVSVGQTLAAKIGRASCRERVWIGVGAVSINGRIQ